MKNVEFLVKRWKGKTWGKVLYVSNRAVPGPNLIIDPHQSRIVIGTASHLGQVFNSKSMAQCGAVERHVKSWKSVDGEIQRATSTTLTHLHRHYLQGTGFSRSAWLFALNCCWAVPCCWVCPFLKLLKKQRDLKRMRAANGCPAGPSRSCGVWPANPIHAAADRLCYSQLVGLCGGHGVARNRGLHTARLRSWMKTTPASPPPNLFRAHH